MQLQIVLLLLAFTLVNAEEASSNASEGDVVSNEATKEVDGLTGAKSSGGYGYSYGNGHGYGNYGGYGNYAGYGNGDDYGNSHYSSGHRGRISGNIRRRGHGSDAQPIVPVRIPYIDRNGCRFPGDIVCDRTTPPLTPICNYKTCLLNDENKNLWKKPTMILTPLVQACGEKVGVLTEFCNDNEILLKAIGFIKDDEGEEVRTHPKKYAKAFNPCLLSRDNCPKPK